LKSLVSGAADGSPRDPHPMNRRGANIAVPPTVDSFRILPFSRTDPLRTTLLSGFRCQIDRRMAMSLRKTDLWRSLAARPTCGVSSTGLAGRSAADVLKLPIAICRLPKADGVVVGANAKNGKVEAVPFGAARDWSKGRSALYELFLFSRSGEGI
jgi:hypothetical protein